MTTLRAHLIASLPQELQAATEHPFLKQAATSQLPVDRLKAWLGQDRLYAYSYISFISSITSRLSISTQDRLEESLEGRYASEMIDCLINIRREIKMFEQTAADEGWLEDIITARPSVETRTYQDLFAGAASQSRPLLNAVVTLWATEFCYLTAWRHAQSFLPMSSDTEGDVMQRVFIPNWSSAEFEQFVELLGNFVDEFSANVKPDELAWRESEEVQQAFNNTLALLPAQLQRDTAVYRPALCNAAGFAFEISEHRPHDLSERAQGVTNTIMRLLILSTTVLAFAQSALAAFGVTVALSPSAPVAGQALTITFADAGGSPALAALKSGVVQLWVGGNTGATALPLSNLGTVIYGTSLTLSAVISPGLAGNTANGFYIGVTSTLTDGGSVINYSNRFSISGMTGTTPSQYASAAASASGPPDAVNNAAAAAVAGTAAGGSYTVPYGEQTGLTKYAPMQSVPPTKISKKNPTPLYSTSAYTKATTWLAQPTVLTTLTASQTFSVASIENTVAPQPMPNADMAKFLARWRD